MKRILFLIFVLFSADNLFSIRRSDGDGLRKRVLVKSALMAYKTQRQRRTVEFRKCKEALEHVGFFAHNYALSSGKLKKLAICI